MSTKYVAVAAAIAAVAVTQTEASRFSIDHHKKGGPLVNRPTAPILFDEEQADWNFNAGVSGGAGGKPQWNVGIGATWKMEEEAQKLRLKKITNTIKKVNNVLNKAEQVGLLEEEQVWLPSGQPKIIRCFPTMPNALLDKEDEAEQTGWIVDNTKTRLTPAIPDWKNPGHTAAWDEDEFQKLKLKKIIKAVKKVNNVVNKATQLGLLDEDQEQADWNFNAGVSGGAGGKPQWQVGIGATWDEEEEQKIKLKKIVKIVRTAAIIAALEEDQEQADWNFNAGIQGGAGGKPQWNVGIGATWDEEEEQKLKFKKIIKAVKKVNKVINKAEQLGLFDEDAEQHSPLRFDSFVKTATVLSTLEEEAQVAVGTLDEDEDEAQKLKLKKIVKIAKTAALIAALEEEGADIEQTWSIGAPAKWPYRTDIGVNKPWEEEEQGEEQWKNVQGRPQNPACLGLNCSLTNVQRKPRNHACMGLNCSWEEEEEGEQGVYLPKLQIPRIKLYDQDEDQEQEQWKNVQGRPQPHRPACMGKNCTWDEEQANWNVGAGIQAGVRSKPQWKTGLGATFDEEQQVLGEKINNALKTIRTTVSKAILKAKSIPSKFDEDNEQDQEARLFNCIKRPVFVSHQSLKKLDQVVETAKQNNVLDEEQAQALNASIANLAKKIDLDVRALMGGQ